MKKFILILTLIAFVGCKDKDSNESKEQVQKPTGNEFFSVTLDVIAKKDDAFHIFYTEDGTTNFSEENSVWVEFKGSEVSQKLNFNLPKDISPTHLRIDFGVNKEQPDVKVNFIEMSYFGKTNTIPGANLSNFFRPNELSTVIDPSTQTVKRLLEDANASIYPLATLTAEIEKVTQ